MLLPKKHLSRQWQQSSKSSTTAQRLGDITATNQPSRQHNRNKTSHRQQHRNKIYWHKSFYCPATATNTTDLSLAVT